MRAGRRLVRAAIGWDEAFALIDERLAPVLAAGGRDAVAVYLGNPSAHGLSSLIYGRVFAQGAGDEEHLLGLDRRPVPQAARLGADVRRRADASRIPDLDRTQYLLCLGANPLASNGSLMTAPDVRGRLKAHPGPRRQGRRRRPAAHAHGAGGRRAPLHPPGHRRAAARRDRQHAVRRGPRRRRRAGRAPRGPRRGAGAARAVHRRGRRRRRPASPPTTCAASPASSPPRSPRRSTGGSARRRSALRHGRQLADRRAQRPDGQPRPAGRRDVHQGRGRRRRTPRARRAAARARAPGAGPAACAARARSSASCRSPAWPRRSRRRARARSARWSRSPATRSSSTPERRAA